ncbi:MAG: M18 family aminopeptidase [Actinobacteria bacterium]|nr:M18 family aminopeptidase [Actinomycetota bacterium]
MVRAMFDDRRGYAREVGSRIDASPTPYHAVATAQATLERAGFRRLDVALPWSAADVARGFVAEGGTLVAWAAGDDPGAAVPFDLAGAHTDSPNLRIRPQPDTGRAGWRQVAVEVYGGALLNSWLDRDLGVAGRVAVRRTRGGPAELRLFHVDRPVMRVPQLAIHLDRDVNERGLQLNKQLHMAAVLGLGDERPGAFRRLVAETLDVSPDDVVSWDAMAVDTAPSTLAGLGEDLLSAPRIDNQVSCIAAVDALVAAGERDGRGTTAAISLFDHEEVGSTSATGADGVLLAGVLERIVLARGGSRQEHLRALAASRCASADGAHATHPNYAERHEPGHWIRAGAGPVVKVNVNQRYATDAATQAEFEIAADAAGVPVQRFSSRGDMPCGSTIGPLTAARSGMRTVDVGVAQLAMHSARELCGADDPAQLAAALTEWLAGAGR